MEGKDKSQGPSEAILRSLELNTNKELTEAFKQDSDLVFVSEVVSVF